MTDKERIEALREWIRDADSILAEAVGFTADEGKEGIQDARRSLHFALRADDEAARKGEPSQEAREAAMEWLAEWSNDYRWPVHATVRDLLAQPPDVQAAIRDELGGARQGDPSPDAHPWPHDLNAEMRALATAEPSQEAREAARAKCPECNGQGRVDRGGWQNDGHGRQEWVYLGRGPCTECGGSGQARDELEGGA